MPVYENTQIINEQEITIAIEVDKLPSVPGPYQDLRDIKKFGKKARDLFGDGLELAKNCATRVVNSIKEMGGTAKPDEFQVQFSIKLDTEVGAIIAKSSTEAQLQVTMTWKTDEEKQKMTSTQQKKSIPILPYNKIVGQENLKMALEIAYIAGARLGGVLVSGHRGTGKSTTVRAFAQMMYDDLPVTLPINATEDRVVGGYKIDALMQGDPVPQSGLLQDANGKILYIDEVNLLDDHIVNIILDTAATGILSVQRQGINIPASETHFTLVGTMNPEEGYLRPQLRDRFGLMAHIITHPEHRADILQTVLAFDMALAADEKNEFLTHGYQADDTTKIELNQAKEKQISVDIPEPIVEKCAELAEKFKAVGHRADFFLALAARAQAARSGAAKVESEHLRDVAPLVLTHRRLEQSEHWFPANNEEVAKILNIEVAPALNVSKKEP